MSREMYTVEGVLYRNLREVSKAYGCNYNTLVNRLNRGIPIYDAIYSDRWKPGFIPFEEKIYGSVDELAAATGKSPVTISNRLENGWLVWLAVTTPPKYAIDGKEFTTLDEVAVYYNLNRATLHTRIWRGKMRLYDAVYYHKPVVWDGVNYNGRKEMCEKLEINYSALNKQLYQGRAFNSVVISLLSRKQGKLNLKRKRKQQLAKTFASLIQAYQSRIEDSFSYDDTDFTDLEPITYKPYKYRYPVRIYDDDTEGSYDLKIYQLS